MSGSHMEQQIARMMQMAQGIVEQIGAINERIGQVEDASRIRSSSDKPERISSTDLLSAFDRSSWLMMVFLS